MKHLKQLLLNLAFLLVLHEQCAAQLPKMNVTPPTAASLIKFVDLPVNYHTGIPQISIPIHTINEGSLSLPIGLSYHAGGLKVMEQSSWVGAGWSIQSGGVITRSPRGHFDELSNGFGPYLSGSGYYPYYMNGTTNVIDFSAFSMGFKDGEPDLFFFNFNGYSGKFYFRADSTVMLEGSEDIIVRANICTTCTSIERLSGFTVITPSGEKYFFGKTLDITTDIDAMEWTRTFPAGTGLTFAEAPSSWYLYKIESANKKDVINLYYANEDYAYFNIATIAQTNLSTGLPSSGMSLVKQCINGVRLDRITYNGGIHSVNFIANDSLRQDLSDYTLTIMDVDSYHADAGARALKKIQISEGSLCKEFVFNHYYFIDNSHPILSTFEGVTSNYETSYNLHTDKKRLKLKAIQEKTCDASIVLPPHEFYYYQDNEVPRTLSLGQDHWGYYNGHNENRYLIPQFSINGGNTFYMPYYGIRDSSWPEMRAGSLREIKYPIGGRSEMVYGHHTSLGTKFIQTGTTSSTQTLVPSKWNRNLSTTFTVSKGSICTLNISVNGTSYSDFYCGPRYFNSIQVGKHEFTLPNGTYTFSAYCTDPDSGQPSHNSTAALTVSTPVGYIGTVPYDVGGLRVESIKKYESISSPPMVTTFDYTNNGENTGVLFSVPVYIAQLKNDITEAAGLFQGLDADFPPLRNYGFYTDLQGHVDYTYSPGSIHPMQTSAGAHFGYGQVKVTQPNGGYTKYYYNTHSSNTYTAPVTSISYYSADIFGALNWPPAPEMADPERGSLEKTEIYEASGKRLKLIKSENTYTFHPEGITAFQVKAHASNLLGTEYEVKRSKRIFERTSELVFDQLDPTKPPKGIISESSYSSPNHSMLTKQVVYEMTSWNQATEEIVKGKVLSEIRNSYVLDLKIPACNNSYTAYSTLQTAISNALSTFNDVRYHTGTGSPMQIFNAWQVYAQQVNAARATYVASRKAYYFGDGGSNRGSGVNCESNTYYYTPADASTKAIINLKILNNIAPVLETSSYRDGKFLSSGLTTYSMFNNNRKYIYPSAYHTISTSAPADESMLTAVNIQVGTTYKKDDDYKLEETYSFSNGLQSEVTAKGGVITSYKWGYNNRYPVAQIVNAPEAQVYYNSFEEPSGGGTSGAAFTGTKYFSSGSLSIGLSLPAGPVYKMSYWYYNSTVAKWIFSGELAYNESIASGGTRLDEVRVYPQGAMVTTYSYTEGYGASTIIDTNNKKITYNYDKLGRVISILDHYGKLLQSFQYHYKDQIPNTY
jgi:YD repeat-containing protein